MDLQQRIAILSLSPGFESLPSAAIDALASAMVERNLNVGDQLFSRASDERGLHLVLDGELRADERDPYKGTARIIGQGEAVDELQSLAGIANRICVTASKPSLIGDIDETIIDKLDDQYPDIRKSMDRVHRRQLLARLYPIFGTFDRAFLDSVEQMADWVHIDRGGLLFEQDSVADGIFLVITGRMRTSSVEADGRIQILGESCRGEVVGELAFFGIEQRTERVEAVRDSVLVGFTKDEFNELVRQRPEILTHVTRTLVEKLHRPPGLGSAAGGVTNIAIIAVSPGLDLHAAASRLAEALVPLGRTLHITSDDVNRLMGEPGIANAWENTDDDARLLAWLDARETRNRFVLYEADATVSLWTRRCVRLADRIILVADANADPELSDTEKALKELEGATDASSRMLLLMHSPETRMPSGTAKWLDAREVREHFHVRVDRQNDMERVARILAGRAVGIVLGGGGARGFAHIGILKALEDAGIPVDMIGGTSMGASVASQFALGWSSKEVAAMLRKVYVDIKPQNEYTLPLLSFVSTKKAQMCGVMIYGDMHVEDTWLPFFCISSNLTTAKQVIHRRGLLRDAVLASAALPAFVPPILHQKELLVDGGLLNNVPTDVMREAGCGVVLASEVSVEEDAVFSSERIPTTWELLRGRIRRSKRVKFPSMLELAFRASMLYSTSMQNQSVESADFCFRPPIDRFGLVDFLRIDEIVALGHDYATTVIPELKGKALSVL
jgi:NTE family protein/lysophospholipid hydrolase